MTTPVEIHFPAEETSAIGVDAKDGCVCIWMAGHEIRLTPRQLDEFLDMIGNARSQLPRRR